MFTLLYSQWDPYKLCWKKRNCFFLPTIVYFSICLTSNKLYWIEDQLADVSTRFYMSASWRWRVEPSATWLDTLQEEGRVWSGGLNTCKTFLFTPFVYWKPDKREAEGGESQSSREPGIGGGEQPLGESVESSYRVGARKEGTQKYSADQYTSIQGLY